MALSIQYNRLHTIYFNKQIQITMGNKQTKTQQPTMIEHEKLGPIRIFQVNQKNENGETQQISKMQITRNILEKEKYEHWVNQLKKINDAEGHELFLVPETQTFQKAGLCGSNGFSKITYPKFEFVLSSEIKNRNNLNKYFDQTEIWYVLYNLVRAGNKFELLKQKIGDIHPNNILINQDGQTAIISRLSLPQEPDNFHKYIEDRKAQIFLAPQQMKQQDIDKSSYDQKIDKCLAEVFSIGLTVLSAGTLQHCNDVYYRDPFRINTQRLATLLDQFSKRYSPYLTQTLKTMLELTPEKRVRSKQLYTTLSKYEAQILDLEEFQTAPSYNQQSPNNGYYNQPYQPYTAPQGYVQPSNYSYPVANVAGTGPGNPQYVQNVRWNENVGQYKRI